MLFKLLGLKYINAETPGFSGEYLSNLSPAGSGDTLVDEDGNPLTFSLVGVPYDSAPACADLDPGDTELWYDPSNHVVFALTKELDGTCHYCSMGDTSGGGDMLKSVYDPDGDGIVVAANSVNDGSYSFTATAIYSHTGDASIHRTLDDGRTTATNLWSADKIQTELDTKSDVGHVHAVFTSDVNGFTPAPGDVPMDYVLRPDATWGPSNVDIAGYAEQGDILVFGGDRFLTTRLMTDDLLSVEYSPDSGSLLVTYNQLKHNALTHLDADDHPQYYNATRLSNWYAYKTIDSLSDVTDTSDVADMLIRGADGWVTTSLQTEGLIDVAYDEYTGTLTFSTTAVSAHGDLSGLSADDHTQYYNTARLASWYSGKTLGTLSDVTDDSDTGNLLIKGSSGWAPVVLQTQGDLTAEYNEYDSTLTLTGVSMIDSLVEIYERYHSDLYALDADDHTQYYNESRLNSALLAGDNVEIDYDSDAGTFLFSATGGGGGGTSNVGVLNDLEDVDTTYPEDGDMLIYYEGEWRDVTLQTEGPLSIVYNVTDGSLTFDLKQANLYEHEEPYDESVWTIDHGLGTTAVIVQAYDTDKKLIVPDEIQIVSSTRVVITFSTPTAGRAYVASGLQGVGVYAPDSNEDNTIPVWDGENTSALADSGLTIAEAMFYYSRIL